MKTQFQQERSNRMQAAGPEVQGLSLSGFGERMVTLCDGRPGLRSGLHVQVVEPDLGERQGSPLPPAATARQRGESDGRGIKGDGHSASDSQQSTPGSQPILDFIASDETLDRCDEIISADGWRLESYRRNPVFQNAHQYGDIIFTLGRALTTEIRSLPSINHSSSAASAQEDHPSTCLYQRVEFATAVNPMARIAYGLYRGKFLNAVSVGFIPLRWQDPNGADHQTGRGVRTAPPGSGVVAPDPAVSGLATPEHREGGPVAPEHRGGGLVAPEHPEGGLVAPKRSGGGRASRIYLEQELLEVSAVAIPANPGALALAVKSGAVEKSDLKDTLDLLRQLTSAAPAQSAGPTSETRSLLSLARTLRNLLRRTG
jgi:hypothetical protein